MTKFNKYTVVTEDNLKEITDGKMTVHYVEPDTLFSEPRFLAIDIAREMGYANTGALRQYPEHEYVDTDKGNLKRTLTRYEVEDILSRQREVTRQKSAPFREFWEETVLPEFDKAYIKLRQERKLRREAEEEVRKLREAIKTLNMLAS